MKCKKCNSKDTIKDGVEYAKKHRNQKYLCNECKYQWRVRLDLVDIQGITADEHVDFESEILPYLVQIGERAKQKNITDRQQTITVPGNKPFAIALLSDIHGGGKSDYTALKKDMDIIEKTDRMFTATHGDEIDNFISSKLTWIQKEQPTTHDMEIRFLRWFFEKLQGKLLWACSGNHNNWTQKASGIDFLRELLKGVKCLYNSNQIVFDLHWGKHKQTWLVRHKFRHSSIFNTTHGIEVAWERMGMDFDVGVCGHTHIATLCRPFIKQDKVRYAVLLGTYKMRDNYQSEIGFPRSHGTGSGAFVYNPDGRVLWTEDLKTARDMLKVWEGKVL